jgi:hypothetical protein
VLEQSLLVFGAEHLLWFSIIFLLKSMMCPKVSFLEDLMLVVGVNELRSCVVGGEATNVFCFISNRK